MEEERIVGKAGPSRFKSQRGLESNHVSYTSKESILAAIVDLLISLLCRGDLFISRLLPLYSRTHSWKPHPYTIPKRSVGVGSHFMVMSAPYIYYVDSHN